MTATASLVNPRLARMLAGTRRAEGAYLSYVRSVAGGGPDPAGRRAGRGSRLNDGHSWPLAAWAEILDRDPRINVKRTARGTERVQVQPWRDGKASAWTYLQERAGDRLFGGSARQMLADLERRGVTP